MKIAYFRYDNGFIGVTERSPTGMKGVVFVGRGPLPGKGIESVCEQAYARNRLERLEKVKATAVPDEWLAALGFEKRLVKPPPPPKPDPKPEPDPKPAMEPPKRLLPRRTVEYDVRLPPLPQPATRHFSAIWLVLTAILILLWRVFVK